ncbi:MAG TPA: phosphoribosylformylglycinamidine cyclo-ligase [Anaerolineales bacterium]|nr:phosphoribosylformylglycinamidine cyclo-ligase [Anaerolineales bacterium]HRF49989.1 phosphoribosylformylglycinamidine cyclo-ligase [Anaerolineales bacterium]
MKASVDPFQASTDSSSAYAAAGVSIDAGNRAVELMKESVRATYGPEVLAGIGAFGGLYDAGALKAMQRPVLVASTDGVGTKVKLAAQLGRFDGIGQDLVNHCINDILVQGARPLFFMDYVATARLEPEMIAAVVGGLATACAAAGIPLLGGETAEMPGVYAPGEFDVAGTIVGVLERDAILPRPTLATGDVLLGLASSGPHTNGYSLIRTILAGAGLETALPELGGSSLADALLAPHRSYLPIVGPVLKDASHPIKALAHLTGGGFIENIPRVLPAGLGAVLRRGSWPVLPIFDLIQRRGEVDPTEMLRVFNCGIGMVLVCAPDSVDALRQALPADSFVIGELAPGQGVIVVD